MDSALKLGHPKLKKCKRAVAAVRAGAGDFSTAQRLCSQAAAAGVPQQVITSVWSAGLPGGLGSLGGQWAVVVEYSGVRQTFHVPGKTKEKAIENAMRVLRKYLRDSGRDVNTARALDARPEGLGGTDDWGVKGELIRKIFKRFPPDSKRKPDTVMLTGRTQSVVGPTASNVVKLSELTEEQLVNLAAIVGVSAIGGLGTVSDKSSRYYWVWSKQLPGGVMHFTDFSEAHATAQRLRGKMEHDGKTVVDFSGGLDGLAGPYDWGGKDGIPGYRNSHHVDNPAAAKARQAEAEQEAQMDPEARAQVRTKRDATEQQERAEAAAQRVETAPSREQWLEFLRTGAAGRVADDTKLDMNAEPEGMNRAWLQMLKEKSGLKGLGSANVDHAELARRGALLVPRDQQEFQEAMQRADCSHAFTALLELVGNIDRTNVHSAAAGAGRIAAHGSAEVEQFFQKCVRRARG